MKVHGQPWWQSPTASYSGRRDVVQVCFLSTPSSAAVTASVEGLQETVHNSWVTLRDQINGKLVTDHSVADVVQVCLQLQHGASGSVAAQ